MKKLTRTSLSALRSASTVLTEQQQRTIKGGCSMDDMGVGYWDGNNYHWYRTSECTCYGGYTAISQDQFNNWQGPWYGGYVEGWGYVAADVNVYGVNGVYSSSSYGNSSTYSHYSSSSGDYARAQNSEWYNYIAEKFLGLIPLLGQAAEFYSDYIERKTNAALGALLDIGHSGPIIVETVLGTPGSSTDISIRLKIYNGGGSLIYDSDASVY